MNRSLLIISVAFFIVACHNRSKDFSNEILEAEQLFESMVSEKGLAQAFYFFADDSAVIKRENDTLIKGKDHIRAYYLNSNVNFLSLTWSPDVVDVSDDGSMAYTYGLYVWKALSGNGDTTVIKGVFHTVWRKQEDGSWKYVWD